MIQRCAGMLITFTKWGKTRMCHIAGQGPRAVGGARARFTGAYRYCNYLDDTYIIFFFVEKKHNLMMSNLMGLLIKNVRSSRTS